MIARRIRRILCFIGFHRWDYDAHAMWTTCGPKCRYHGKTWSG